MAEDLKEKRSLLERYAKKLEIDSLPAYMKTLFGKELDLDALTLDQANKVVNALKAKAARVGVALEGNAPTQGGASEAQLKFIESLMARGKISHAMLSGYIKDVDPAASIPQQLSKRAASALIDRLTGLAGAGRRFVDPDA